MQKHITDTVHKLLAKDQECRDNDMTLWFKSLEELEGIFFDSDLQRVLRKYPQTSFVRVRANFQNKFHIFEASDKVKMKRCKAKKNWLNWLWGN